MSEFRDEDGWKMACLESLRGIEHELRVMNRMEWDKLMCGGPIIKNAYKVKNDIEQLSRADDT